MDNHSAIDWSKIVALPKETLTCRCSHRFRGWAVVNYKEEKPRLVSKDPCPECGSHIMRGARSDPEAFTIG